MKYKQSFTKLWSRPLCRQFILGISIILTMWGFGLSFCFNLDDSLSNAFFLAKLNPTLIPRDSYVVFDHTILGEKKRLVKKVLGVTNDVIRVEQDEVWVNEHRVGKIKPYSKAGLPLFPVQSRVIPEGFIFTAGSHPDSFDSRYQDFGLVPLSHILARAYPVF